MNKNLIIASLSLALGVSIYTHTIPVTAHEETPIEIVYYDFDDATEDCYQGDGLGFYSITLTGNDITSVSCENGNDYTVKWSDRGYYETTLIGE